MIPLMAEKIILFSKLCVSFLSSKDKNAEGIAKIKILYFDTISLMLFVRSN